jgi:hypothetical protein
MAFQMCQSTECQLLSTNQFQSSSTLVTMKECSYYDMLPDLEQVKKFTAVDRLKVHGIFELNFTFQLNQEHW